MSKVIEWMRDFGRNDAERTDEAIHNRFQCLGDEARCKELQALSSWIDAGSLREKSQLIKLGRELNQIHNNLRRINR